MERLRRTTLCLRMLGVFAGDSHLWPLNGKCGCDIRAVMISNTREGDYPLSGLCGEEDAQRAGAASFLSFFSVCSQLTLDSPSLRRSFSGSMPAR